MSCYGSTISPSSSGSGGNIHIALEYCVAGDLFHAHSVLFPGHSAEPDTRALAGLIGHDLLCAIEQIRALRQAGVDIKRENGFIAVRDGLGYAVIGPTCSLLTRCDD